jgi:hypothetical protein
MEDDIRSRRLVTWGLGAAGLSSAGAAFALPYPYKLIGGSFVLVLFLLLFGGYYLWQRHRARRQREQFTSAIEAQTAAAPKAISDPQKRADLDKVRGKFQTGLQEFRSRGKDIYKLPWYVIIGESGSGKTEAIRHSGIDFPPGLNKEHQGSGGTVNMDWWFTNRGVILDTAGSLVFPEAGAAQTPEWQEFLRLLKKARPHCPVNGLFLVLSVESLIKDSADRISQKASRLAQHLDVIQRTLDVRFPVYLLVTKCDLLAGFREFFDSIEDPLLQHQIFGWSNPDPLDAAFRPDLIEQHLGSVAQRLRRRRSALLRELPSAGRSGNTQQFFASSYKAGGGAMLGRRLDEVDSMFALPESMMRLAPRLRRYLETIFVAGEWSAKPVFLRGIYFTSSMREGKALDEAIAFATGLSLDQLPEDRTWEKDRAFFLRDLFHDKVFRESGLVTRATNTLKLLRQRQLAIFGSAAAALLLLLVFAGFAAYNLNKSVRKEAKYWQAGAAGLHKGEWSPAIVTNKMPGFAYGGTNLVPVAGEPTLLQFHEELKGKVESPLAAGLFKPMVLLGFGKVKDRPKAQRILFEDSVLQPLVRRTREKMSDPKTQLPDAKGVSRHRDALLSLMQLEADWLLDERAHQSGFTGVANKPERLLRTFLSYLTESDFKVETNLVNLFAWTYSKEMSSKNDGGWPPRRLLGGDTLGTNQAIQIGLQKFYEATRAAQTNVDWHLGLLNNFADALYTYYRAEDNWLKDPAGACPALDQLMRPPKAIVDASRRALPSSSLFGPLTNLTSCYLELRQTAIDSSGPELARQVRVIAMGLPESEKSPGKLFGQIQQSLKNLAEQGATNVQAKYDERRAWIPILDTNCLAQVRSNGPPVYELRWALYTNACALAAMPAHATEKDIGDEWKNYMGLKKEADAFQSGLSLYQGALSAGVFGKCSGIATSALQRLKGEFVADYAKLVRTKLEALASQSSWAPQDVTNSRFLFEKIGRDLSAAKSLGDQEQVIAPLGGNLSTTKQKVLQGIDKDLRDSLAFPVRLSSTRTIGLTELSAKAKLLNGLVAELQHPVWTSAPEALAPLQRDFELYLPIINMLVNEDGTPTEWELAFIGPKGETADSRIIAFFRYMQVSLKETESVPDLTKVKEDERFPLGKASVNGGITITFQTTATSATPTATPVKLGDWWLPRLMRDNHEERQEVPGRWRFRFKLEYSPRNLSGYVTLEARPVNAKQLLPKFETWSQ